MQEMCCRACTFQIGDLNLNTRVGIVHVCVEGKARAGNEASSRGKHVEG